MALIIMVLVSGAAMLVILSGFWVASALWRELTKLKSEPSPRGVRN